MNKKSVGKRLYIVANLKANPQTEASIKDWVNYGLKKISSESESSNKFIIFAPSSMFILVAQQAIKEAGGKSLIYVGAQNASAYDPGQHTGEITLEELKESGVNYVIVGHSERRNMGETDEVVADKARRSVRHNIRPILCVRSLNDSVPDNTEIIAYEPVFAIGSGNPDSPENANTVAHRLKEKYPNVKFVLYGGSVNAKNVHSFTEQPDIDGVLVGRASVDPKSFFDIVENA